MSADITEERRAEITVRWEELLQLVERELTKAELTIRNKESRPCYDWQARTFNVEGTVGCPVSVVVDVNMRTGARVCVDPHGPVSYGNKSTAYTTKNQKQNAKKAIVRAKKLVDEDRQLHEEGIARREHVDKMKRLTNEELGDLSDILMSGTFSGKKPIRILSRGQKGGYTMQMDAFLPLEQVKGIISTLRLEKGSSERQRAHKYGTETKIG